MLVQPCQFHFSILRAGKRYTQIGFEEFVLETVDQYMPFAGKSCKADLLRVFEWSGILAGLLEFGHKLRLGSNFLKTG